MGGHIADAKLSPIKNMVQNARYGIRVGEGASRYRIELRDE
jgi:hypothetical protein